MLDVPHQRMKHIQESLETDSEYLWLRSRRHVMEEQVAVIFGGLSSKERDVLLEYRGISQEIMLRMVEMACFVDVL